jgi:hypothetical protein
MATRNPLHPVGSVRFVRYAHPKATIGQAVTVKEARHMGRGEYRYLASGLWFYEDDLSLSNPLEAR